MCARWNPFPASAPWRHVMPNYRLGRDLMGVLFVRTAEIGADISTISRLLHECCLQPISTHRSG